MAKNFAEIAFTRSVKAMQEKLGSRSVYARMEKGVVAEGLTEKEINFISGRDSFYMASIGENGFPYIQHRGGPKGFLKVLGPKRLGFVDFKGNMQYITAGNIASNNKVCLIMVDYPARTRLKIFARAEMLEPEDEPELYVRLKPEEYKFHPERLFVLNIEAYDWNCPQHIVPRYTLEDIEEAFTALHQHIGSLEAEIKKLKGKLADARG